jgi:anti-anti-sigma regulatory factor
MHHEPSSETSGGLALRQQHIGDRVVVTLTGSLDLDGVEELAACADRICRSRVRAACFDVTGVAAADDAGVRTLEAACRCLSLHGVAAEVLGIGGQFRQVLSRLGLTLPEGRARPARQAPAAGPVRTPAAARPASAAIGG